MLLDGLHNGVKYTVAMPPVAAVTGNTAFVSNVLDTNGFLQNEFIGLTGTNADTDATYTVLVEDGSTSTSFTAVDDAYLLGTEALASIDFSNDNTTFKIGYIGPNRYVRVTVTPANNTGNAFVAGIFAQGKGRKEPYSTQIV